MSVYDGAFIKFSYDGSLTVSDETLTSFMLTNAGEENVITVDIYTNEENKSPYDFVSQSDNVINYYEEAEKNDIVPEEIYLDDKLHAVKFEKFPGIAEQDIYLVIVDGYLVQVSVRDMFEEVFQTTVLTIEKA